MRKYLLILLFSSASLTLAANATPVLYSDSAIASGTIGPTTFTNQLVTIDFRANTNGVSCSPAFCEDSTGVGYLTIGNSVNILFTDSIDFFDNQSYGQTGVAGIGDLTNGSILDTENNTFETYTGTTAIGPLSGTSFYRTDLTYGTVAGNLNFTSVANTSTFTAAFVPTTTTPEPSSFVLLGSGIAALAGAARRRFLRS